MKKILKILKKKWPEYLIEAMVIIASILGAYALDNWNENRKERETTSILAKSLIEDLKKDIDFLETGILFSNEKIDACDKASALISTPRNKWNISEIYNELTIVGQSNPFFPTTGTYNQIVTSGTLKLFDQEIANKLNAYDMQLKKVEYWSRVEDDGLWLMADILWEGINIKALGDIRFGMVKMNDQYMKIPESSRDKLTNLIALTQIYRRNILKEYQEQLNLAKGLTELLKSHAQLK